MKKLYVYAKSADRNDIVYTDDQGVEHSLTGAGGDYVPRNICIGGGDNVQFEVDIETGRILDWDADGVKARIAELTAPADE